MKIIPLVFFLFIFSDATHSQIKKNQFITGGMIDFSHSSGDALLNNTVTGDSKGTRYSVTAGGGYFFIDRLCGGVRIGAGGTKDEQAYYVGTSSNIFYKSESKIDALNISPFIRYYLLGLTQKVNLFAEGGYIYSHGTSESDIIQNTGTPGSMSQSHFENKFNSHGFFIAAGPAIFLNPKVSLELFVKYSSGKTKETDQTGDAIGAGLGFQVHLGK